MEAVKDFFIRMGLEFLVDYIITPLSILLLAVIIVLVSYLFVWIRPIRYYVPAVVAVIMGGVVSWQHIQREHDLQVRRMLFTYLCATGIAYWWFRRRDEGPLPKAQQAAVKTNSPAATGSGTRPGAWEARTGPHLLGGHH